MGDFSKLAIARELPPAGHYTERARTLFEALCGSQIVEIGTPDAHDLRIEGGGLIIDFIPKGSTQTRRVVLAFNENGMWVKYDSAP